MTQAENAPEKKSRPPLRVRVAVVLASVVFALAVAEVFLRATGYSYQTFYRPDDALGYTLEPGAEGWHKKEGRSYVRVNSDGLRDREYARRKPPGTLRVAVLGDSYAEALQVAEEDGFTCVVERRLAGCPSVGGRAVEVINFGVSGYSTAQELLTLRRKVWAYEPDVVLLMVTTNNDVTDNVRAFKEADDIPYVTLSGDELAFDNSFRDSGKFRFRTSVLARAGRWLYSNLRFVHAVQQARHTFKARLAQRRDRQLAEAERERREPAARAAIRARLGPGADLLYPDRRFEEFGRREGVTVFGLAPELQAHADRERVFLHGWEGDLGNGHWNEQGHRLAGELLTQKLCVCLAQGGGAAAEGGLSR